jgi:hypothetical protein
MFIGCVQRHRKEKRKGESCEQLTEREERGPSLCNGEEGCDEWINRQAEAKGERCEEQVEGTRQSRQKMQKKMQSILYTITEQQIASFITSDRP